MDIKEQGSDEIIPLRQKAGTGICRRESFLVRFKSSAGLGSKVRPLPSVLPRTPPPHRLPPEPGPAASGPISTAAGL